MKIKLDRADTLFSKWVRIRDGLCVRCGRRGEPDKDRFLIIGLQNSHYFGRSNENTRFDPENCDSLCMGCHQLWDSAKKEDYRDFKIGQLGEDGFKMLRVRADTYKKKDRKMEIIKWREALKELT